MRQDHVFSGADHYPSTGVEVPAGMVLRWERHVQWDTSTVLVRAIRDYLIHDLPGQARCGGQHG